jgi:hypothetical protein
MENSANTTLVAEVARDVLAEIAPQEMPIFAAASRAYFTDPAAALKQSRSKDNVLGFGTDALAVLFTPAVLLVLSETLEYLTRVAAKATADGLAKEIPEAIKAMFKRFHSSPADTPSGLTKEHIAMIHGNILATAKNLRLPAEKARSLANAVTAQLVLSKE